MAFTDGLGRSYPNKSALRKLGAVERARGNLNFVPFRATSDVRPIVVLEPTPRPGAEMNIDYSALRVSQTILIKRSSGKGGSVEESLLTHDV